jgi:tetratricopeptide (TPR) repeat protein
MRKDNAIFFVSGLAFGVFVGYFLFQSVIQSPGSPAAASPPGSMGTAGTAMNPPALETQEIAALEREANDNPNDAEVRSRIGLLYMEAGRYSDAVRWFREALARKGDDLHVRSHLATSLAGLGRIDESVTEYEAALEIDPSHPQSLLGLGRVLLLGRNDIRGGLEVWERLIESAPDSPEALSIREELEALKAAHSGA